MNSDKFGRGGFCHNVSGKDKLRDENTDVLNNSIQDHLSQMKS